MSLLGETLCLAIPYALFIILIGALKKHIVPQKILSLDQAGIGLKKMTFSPQKTIDILHAMHYLFHKIFILSYNLQ